MCTSRISKHIQSWWECRYCPSKGVSHMFIITGRGVVPSNKIVFLFREMRAFQKILLKQSTHSECVECAILILLKLRLRFIVDFLNVEMFELLYRKISKARVFNAVRQFFVEKWTKSGLSNADRKIYVFFPISVEKMQFIPYLRFIVDLLNVEMFELLYRKISKARVFNAVRKFGVGKWTK